jgi:Transglycosylase-like domain
MRWPEPAYTEQSLALLARPTKGGAVRIRIALATASAVALITTIAISILATSLLGPTVASAAIETSGPNLASSAPSTTPTTSPLGERPFSVLPLSDRLPVPAAPAVTPVPVVVVNDATSVDTADWQCIRIHESGDRYNSPAAPSGAYGIVQVTWHSNGFNDWPWMAAPAFQDFLALKLYNEFGWRPWSSRFACGL